MPTLCRQCQRPFETTEEDRAMLDFIGKKSFLKETLPSPALCPDCREQNRCASYNLRHLYVRKCDGSGKDIVSMYSTDKPFPVYDQEYWWDARWDARDFGRAYDFSRPFFAQFRELYETVPRPALFTAFKHDINCAYTNHSGRNRNCYLIFDSDDSWDCQYGYSLNGCKNCNDCYRTEDCELCYECVDSRNCYRSFYCQNCIHCQESQFLRNCIGCKHCMFCVNQHQKEYCFFNEQLTKEEFEKRRGELVLGSSLVLMAAVAKFREFEMQFPRRYRQDVQAENCIGDYLSNCKDAFYCFDSRNLHACRYIFQAFMSAENCMDCQEVGDNVQRCYQCNTTGYNASGVLFCTKTLEQVHDIAYSMECRQCTHLFGCMGMRKHEYCILNKQYTKEAFEEMIPRITAHMRETGEFGEYFPKELWSFAYNESVAQEYYPLTKEQVLSRGWQWKDDLPFTVGKETVGIDAIPDAIQDVPDSIINEILVCASTGKNFRITAQEFAFYRKMGLPIPRLHPDERHRMRSSLRNPRMLWNRACDSCQMSIPSTYSPERKEKVLCEKCFQGEVY